MPICHPFCVAMWINWLCSYLVFRCCSCSLRAGWWTHKLFKAKTPFSRGQPVASLAWHEPLKSLLPTAMGCKAWHKSLALTWAARLPMSVITRANLNESLIRKWRGCVCARPCCTYTLWRQAVALSCSLMVLVSGWALKAQAQTLVLLVIDAVARSP
jgi:hypothetical protein